MSVLVAVIDIGKTNKKIALIDEHLNQVASRSASFPAALNADGILCERIDDIRAWLTQELAALFRETPFAAISISTHGACWAALDEQGELSIPVIAYEHDLGAEQNAFDRDFYGRCGALEQLQDETGSCDLPLLVNPAKMVFFAQRRMPTRWATTARMVNYPQFWGFRLTGQLASEATYSANHSFLFAIRDGVASSAAKALGVECLLDFSFKKPWDQLGILTVALQKELSLPALPVTVGIHDSNSALLPYLIKHGDRDFVLNSTGTWCVAMHRVPAVTYRADELGQKIIFNIDAFGHITKTSFLMGGMDYGLYHELIGGTDPTFDATRLDHALARIGDAVLPGAFPSQFPRCSGGLLDNGTPVTLADLKRGHKPAWFHDSALAHDLLNISLALQTEVALRRTDITPQTTIFVEGGFRNNTTFLGLLAALFPTNTIACTNLAQASACGAAILGHALLQGTDPMGLATHIAIDETTVARPTLPHLAAYRAHWLAAVS